MSTAVFDVTGIGNAIVDVISHTENSFIDQRGLTKGTMHLIDQKQATDLYDVMGPGIECSGGSAANTMAGIASFGGRGAYVGKVAKDQLGEVFAHDLKASGLLFDTVPLVGGAPTARCLILVTPDAQRTMCTFLGACVELGPEDIDERLIQDSQVIYLEGYLWDPPRAKEAFLKAARVAHQVGRKVSLTLSDPFCVERHRASFQDLVEQHVDILFANESEIQALYQTTDFDAAVAAVRGRCEIAAITRSEKGSLIVTKDQVHEVAAAPIERAVDSTGAGDLYAAGFLFGYTHGFTLPDAGRIGSMAAAEVIQHFGARPEVSLKAYLLTQS